jgi:hypothetical protein
MDTPPESPEPILGTISTQGFKLGSLAQLVLVDINQSWAITQGKAVSRCGVVFEELFISKLQPRLTGRGGLDIVSWFCVSTVQYKYLRSCSCTH